MGKLPPNPGPPKIRLEQNSWSKPVCIPADRLCELLECDFRTKTYAWVRRLLSLINEKGYSTEHIDTTVLLAVMEAQRYRCQYSNFEFILPEMESKVGYKAWLLRQPGHVRVRSPIPIRPDTSRPFAVDNLLFVGEPFAMICEGTDEAFMAAYLPGIEQLCGIPSERVCERFYAA